MAKHRSPSGAPKPWIVGGTLELSKHARGHVGGMITDAVREVLDDCYLPNVEIVMPMDALPAWTDPEKPYGIGIRIGSALTYLADDIRDADPAFAAKLRRIVEKYYPDDTIEVEISLPGETIYLVDFDTQRSRSIPWQAVQRIRPFSGSVDLRHYKEDSVYSTDDNKHPYKLVRCWIGDDEDDDASWEEGCLLFSDDLIARATIAREVEN